ncbi:piriformospora indica-insensitive protein 2-like [Macadamia integrifolia]|uniref:piriformospora indica-insensitive protein 2-like n=1 Tax=Macadamia integrifolia TaxID=60698 RepID=UPI001C4EAB52|nr:piriformospora indica-insensitive protein 2-like [Macadamia integrifolia]
MKRFTINVGALSLLFLLLVLKVSCLGGEEETSVALMEKTEQEALYSAIQGFVGSWWNGSELYPDPCGWTPIQGVSCDFFDSFWYVTGINIGPVHENSLRCTMNVEFSPYLFELKHLRSLSFFNCFVSPRQRPISIPTQNWEKLAEGLESLEFRLNPGLIGQIPAIFGNLTKLQSLVLLENRLSGELPMNLGNLIRLRRLILAGNQLSGRIPDCLGGLTELLIFDSSRNSVSGTLPLTFGGLNSLLKLDLSDNLLEGKLPEELGNLKNLTLLDLSSNKFSGGLTQSLQEMVSLEELVLSNNPIGGDLMDIVWGNLQNLIVLDVSNMGLVGQIPETMAELKRLRFLGLNNNNLSGNISPKFEAMPCLSTLYLNGNNLTGELKFSEWFYGKMRRRFGAWKNPNVCYPLKLMLTGNVPYGVKPCQLEVRIPDTD